MKARKTIYPHVPDEVLDPFGAVIGDARAVGSRVTCDPPPSDTDRDWLVLVHRDVAREMQEAGFTQEGSPEFYTGNDRGGFRSWRKGDLNIITTQDDEFFDLFMTATELAKRFNLLDKADRIALFQAVLYGVRWHNLEQPGSVMAPTDRSIMTTGVPA